MAIAAAVSRERTFQEFHKEVGNKPFAPDFIDSLTATMRSSECLTERIYAWVRWRAWGNSSQFAVTDWVKDQRQSLDQIDCIVDLSWFEDGKSVEWIVGAPESVRISAREKAEGRKAQYSRGFAQLRDEGRIDFQGRKIHPVVSPAGPKVAQRVADISNFRYDSDFLAHWKDTDISNFEARETVKRQFAEIQKLLREHDRIAEAAHRKYRQSATSGERIIMSVKTLSNTATATDPPDAPEPPAAAAALSPLPDPPPEPAPPVAPEEPTLEEVADVRKALSEYGNPDYKTAELLIVRCRREYRDATTQQIGRKISAVGRGLGRGIDKPLGLLMTRVPPDFRGFVPEAETPARDVDPLEAILADPENLDMDRVAEALGLDAFAVDDLIRASRLPALEVGLNRPGGRYRVRRRDLEAFKNQKENE